MARPPRPTGPRPAGRRRRCGTPPAPARSGCSPAASRSAGPRPTAWSAPTSSPPPTTTACRRRRPPALLALVGIFDIVGTIVSGWLTDRVDPRLLLGVYYALRGAARCSCCRRCSPRLDRTSACSPSSSSTASTGSPRCRRRSPCAASAYGERGADRLRLGLRLAPDRRGGRRPRRRRGPGPLGTYDLAWYVAGALCVVAASFCVAIRYRHTPARRARPPGRPSLLRPPQRPAASRRNEAGPGADLSRPGVERMRRSGVRPAPDAYRADGSRRYAGRPLSVESADVRPPTPPPQPGSPRCRPSARSRPPPRCVRGGGSSVTGSARRRAGSAWPSPAPPSTGS